MRFWKGKDLLSWKAGGFSWPRAFCVLTVALLGGWLVALSTDFLENREYRVYDFLQARSRTFPSRYPLIWIEAGNPTLRTIRQWPWPYALHAQVLERLHEARFVLLDLDLTEGTDSEDEALLAEAIGRYGRVGGVSYMNPEESQEKIQEPLPVFLEVLKHVATLNLEGNAEGAHRKGIWGIETPSEFAPSPALAALEEIYGQTFPISRRRGRMEARMPWKTMSLYRSDQGIVDFWINRSQQAISTYEYIDVLEGKTPPASFAGAFVVVSFGGASARSAFMGNRAVFGGKHILYTMASLLSPFAVDRISPTAAALLTAFLATFSASLGFIHFKQSLVFLALLFFSCAMSTTLLFLKGGLWLPITGPILVSFCGYIGSQAMLSWHLYNEWDVRSLSIKPLLAITQKADADLDKGISFDDYLRAMWSDIEEKTGVILKSTQVNENFSLVQNYLLRAHKTAQQSGESFHIIKNASDTPPRHRMLLPLPAWQSRDKKAPQREYVILAWNGNIPTETLTSLAALTLFAAVYFHSQEEGRRRKDMLFKTIEAIMVAVEAKDPTTSEHSRRVATLSKNLAQWLNLTPQEVEDIYFSAIIHDIGKLGISDNILNKPAMLTEDEIAEMHRHPSIGEDIMRPVELPGYIISGITQHHERHDGKGYPTGIKGDRMTTAGKIIKVADVFDALTNRRQYKEAWTLEQVRDFFLERRGTEFDPLVVDVFLKHTYLLDKIGLSA
jgi:HD-GYP domain-containing protein (c-di-GMP phosphodiesterase class II)/CHASE2 domain-containing sensor protein